MISLLADTIMLTDLHVGGANGTITRVVVHGTVSPCEHGGARANARYFQTPKAGGAAHYVVDPGEIVACVDEGREAAHAPPNHGSIGVEFCDPQDDDLARWSDAAHQAMLARGALLIADICERHGLPVVWLSADDLRAGASGITGHVQVAEAFRKSDHTDPRDMPVDALMALVTGQGDDLTADDRAQLDNVRADVTTAIKEVRDVRVDVTALHIKVDQTIARLDELLKRP